jgi:hypothetical protein
MEAASARFQAAADAYGAAKGAAAAKKDADVEACGAAAAEATARIDADLNAIKEEYDAIRTERGEIAHSQNGLKKDMADSRARIRALKTKIATELRRIKELARSLFASPAERRALKRALRPDYIALKALMVEYGVFLQRSKKLGMRKQLIAERVGTREPAQMAQETMLNDRCHMHVTSDAQQARMRAERNANDNGANANANANDTNSSRSTPRQQQQPRPRPRPQPRQQQASPTQQAFAAEQARVAALKPTVSEFSAMLEEAYNATPTPQGAKKAYLKLTMKYHPDKHPNSNNNGDYDNRFKNLQTAWDRFKDRHGLQLGGDE